MISSRLPIGQLKFTNVKIENLAKVCFNKMNLIFVDLIRVEQMVIKNLASAVTGSLASLPSLVSPAQPANQVKSGSRLRSGKPGLKISHLGYLTVVILSLISRHPTESCRPFDFQKILERKYLIFFRDLCY